MRLGGPPRTRPAAGHEGRRAAPVRRRAVFRAADVFWAMLVLVGSLLPPRAIAPAMPHFSGADKVAHVGAYAVLSLLAVWGWSGRRWLGLGAAALLFGIMIEFVQPLTGRSLSGMDMLADATGVAGGLVVGWLTVRLRGGA